MGEYLIVRSGTGIDTSNATSTSSTVVEGYTCYVNDELIIGSIPYVNEILNLFPDSDYVLTEGFYDNSSISVTTLEDNTVGTITADSMLKGYRGWVNGTLVEGEVESIADDDITLEPNGIYTIPLGWYSGNNKIVQNIPVQLAVSITPSESEQLLCEAGKWTTGDLLIVGDENLITSNIKNGVEIFGLTGTFTGWVDESAPVGVAATVVGGSGYVYATSTKYTSGADCTTITPNNNIFNFSRMVLNMSVWGYPNGGSDWEWCYGEIHIGYAEYCTVGPNGKGQSFSRSQDVNFGIGTSQVVATLIGRAGRIYGACNATLYK